MKIFIISGKANHGKDTLASYIAEYFYEYDKLVVTTSYAKYLKMYAQEIIGWDGNDKTKPREFLQTIGCEVIRDKFDEDFLVKRMLDDINIYNEYADILIINDARFRNEIELIKNKYPESKTIRVVGQKNNLSAKEKRHVSETSLDGYKKFDYVINNDGELLDLKDKIDTILKEV